MFSVTPYVNVLFIAGISCALQTRLIVPILGIFVNPEKLKHFGLMETVTLV